jgi:hypothetical protein
MNALILRPLAISRPAQLVHAFSVAPANPERSEPLSISSYRQIRNDQRVFSELFGWDGGRISNLEAAGTRYAASVTRVTGEYFSTLGIPPLLGRPDYTGRRESRWPAFRARRSPRLPLLDAALQP